MIISIPLKDSLPTCMKKPCAQQTGVDTKMPSSLSHVTLSRKASDCITFVHSRLYIRMSAGLHRVSFLSLLPLATEMVGLLGMGTSSAWVFLITLT